MNATRATLLLTVVNLAILTLAMRQQKPAEPAAQDVIRARRFELVDERGVVRSSLKIEPEGAVVFRLTDPKGEIRVKLGAGADGSGLLLTDETTEPGIHLLARRAGTGDKPNTTRIVITGADGKQKLIEP
jgi:hypothetical protein